MGGSLLIASHLDQLLWFRNISIQKQWAADRSYLLHSSLAGVKNHLPFTSLDTQCKNARQKLFCWAEPIHFDFSSFNFNHIQRAPVIYRSAAALLTMVFWLPIWWIAICVSLFRKLSIGKFWWGICSAFGFVYLFFSTLVMNFFEIISQQCDCCYLFSILIMNSFALLRASINEGFFFFFLLLHQKICSEEYVLLYTGIVKSIWYYTLKYTTFVATDNQQISLKYFNYLRKWVLRSSLPI